MIRTLILAMALAVPSIAAADKPVAGEYRNNPKWIAYKNRRDSRKAYANYMNAKIRSGRNYSHVPLSYRVNINPAMPYGHLYVAPRLIVMPRVWLPIVIINN